MFDWLLIDALQLWQSVPVLDVGGDPTYDGFNEPITELELVDAVQGRVFALSTFEQRFAVEGTRAIVKRYRAVVEYRADLTIDERSTIIDDASGVYDVLAVDLARDATGPHHYELQLEKVSA